MNVSTLSSTDLATHLRNSGIFLQTGSFIVHLQSAIQTVVDGIALHYADYPLASDTDFADFHVSLAPPRTLRRWFRPQVLFHFDGKSPFKPLPIAQAFPLFEWGLNWCVGNHAHQYLILHAAVIERDGYAAIMPAPPGSGKSTLCAALVNRGWRLLSDELTLVSMKTGMITPLPRPVSLKNESIDVIRNFAPEAIIGPKAHDTLKGTVAHMKAPLSSVERCHEPALPGWIIFPKYESGSPARLKSCSKAQAFMKAAENAINYNVLGLDGFNGVGDLVEASVCHEFTYGRLEDAIKVFDTLEPSMAPEVRRRAIA